MDKFKACPCACVELYYSPTGMRSLIDQSVEGNVEALTVLIASAKDSPRMLSAGYLASAWALVRGLKPLTTIIFTDGFFVIDFDESFFGLASVGDSDGISPKAA